MDERAIDVFARAAAAVPRRRSLLLLGGTGLATVLARPPSASSAKKAKKKCNSRKTCNKEKKLCREAVQERCGASQACLDSFLPCCATCKVGERVRCLVQA